MSPPPTEPVEARPWRPEYGPPPRVKIFGPGEHPTMEVWSRGDWRMATVLARHDWRDGRVIYQMSYDPGETTFVFIRSYRWPQPGLRPYSPSHRPWPAGRSGGSVA